MKKYIPLIIVMCLVLAFDTISFLKFYAKDPIHKKFVSDWFIPITRVLYIILTATFIVKLINASPNLRMWAHITLGIRILMPLLFLFNTQLFVLSVEESIIKSGIIGHIFVLILSFLFFSSLWGGIYQLLKKDQSNKLINFQVR